MIEAAGQPGRLQVKYTIGSLFQFNILDIANNLQGWINHVHFQTVNHFKRRFSALVYGIHLMLCLRKGLHNQMVGDGNRIHSPCIGLVNIFLYIAYTIHLGQLGMHMQLHALLLCFIHASDLRNLFNHIRHKHQLTRIGIIFRFTIRHNTVSIADFRQNLFGYGTTLKTLHDDGIIVITDPQHLDIPSIAQRSCFCLKYFSMDTDTVALLCDVMDRKRYIGIQSFFSFWLEIIAFLFLIHLHRLWRCITFYGNRWYRGRFFHFLYMYFQLKAALLQKLLQQMLILNRTVTFHSIHNLIDKILLIIDRRQ